MPKEGSKYEGMIPFQYFILYVHSGCLIVDRTGQERILNIEYIMDLTMQELRGMKLVLRDPLSNLDLEDARHILKETGDWSNEKFIAEEGPKNELKQIEFGQKVLNTYKAARFHDYLRARGYATTFDGQNMVELGLVCFDWEELK
jgi:hypothetical protein